MNPAKNDTTEREKQLELVRSYLRELWSTGDVKEVDRIVASDVVGHVNGRDFHGRETLRQRVADLWRTYAHPDFTLEDAIVEGERVVVRWTFRGVNAGPFSGHPATGRSVEITGINIFRIRDSRIAEIWVNADDLGELQQLGISAA